MALIPSGLFVGALAGRSFRMPLAARIAASVLAAAAIAYGVVFHGGAIEDPASSSVPQPDLTVRV